MKIPKNFHRLKPVVFSCELRNYLLHPRAEARGFRKLYAIKEAVLVGGVFVVAFFLRVMYLPQGALTFGFDQARDAYTAQEILGGDIKVQGPSASTPGLFHGVLYDYILVPAYVFSQNPVVAAYWIAFLATLGVVFVYFLGKELTGKAGAGVVAAGLYAVGFKQVQYGTWLSNPALGVWLVPLLYLCLWRWLKDEKKRIYLAILTGLVLGAVMQSEIFLVYHAVVVGVWLFLVRRSWSTRQLAAFLGGSVAGVATVVTAQVKFGMTDISGMAGLFAGPSRPFGYDRLGDYLLLYVNQLGEIFTKDIFPLNEGWGGLWGLAVLVSLVVFWWKTRRSKKLNPYLFATTWVLAHLPVVSLGGVTTPFLTVGLGAAADVASVLVLARWWEARQKWLVAILIGVFVLANLSKVIREDKKGSTLFAIQPDMVLAKQLAAVDWVYESAGGERFSINTVTSPLWINTVWAYLFNLYGKERYGYVPEWHGRDQIGRQGYLPPVSSGTNLYYFIQEPPEGIPPSFIQGEVGTEEARSKFLEEKAFGEIVVQKREKRG